MNGAGMILVIGELLTAPSPSDGEELNSVTVSPGLPGFLAAFILASLVVLLGIDMTRRTRRIQAQARVEERMAAEELDAADGAAQQADPSDAAGQDVETGEGRSSAPADGAAPGSSAESSDGTEGPATDPEDTPSSDEQL